MDANTKLLLERIEALDSRLAIAEVRTGDRHVRLARAIAADIRQLVESASRREGR